MKRVAAFLVLLTLLIYLWNHRKGLTVGQAVGETVEVVDKASGDALHNEYRAVTVLALIAMFAFVMWTVLRAKEREDKAMPPTRESSASSDATHR